MDIEQITGAGASPTGECDCGTECGWGCDVTCIVGCAMGGLLAAVIVWGTSKAFALAVSDTVVLYGSC